MRKTILFTLSLLLGKLRFSLSVIVFHSVLALFLEGIVKGVVAIEKVENYSGSPSKYFYE